MKKLNPQKIKKDFPIFDGQPNLVYLDSASSSQTPQVVLDAMNEYYTGYRANIHRALYDASQRATNAYEEARKDIARFIGADEKEIIFTSGATASSNMLVGMLKQHLSLKAGDEIVTTVMEHHSNLLPLRKLAEEKKLTIRYITLTDDFELDMKQAKKCITAKTKIVSISLASNVLGTVNDIKRLGGLAHKQSAVMIADGTEAVGHLPVDVRALDCDFLFFSAHKMCGPTGIGILYGKKNLLEHMEPSVVGGGIVTKVTETEILYKPTPERFESGTPNIAGAIGLGSAIRYLESIGMKAIHAHTAKLTALAQKKLSLLPGVTVLSGKRHEGNSGIVSFVIEGMHPHDISHILAERNIAVRAGHHCAMLLGTHLGYPATTRASFYLYNSEKDVAALITAVKKAQKIFS
ncbi:MAG: cysteine desulfurase [Candidatus Lloydbacteria bacterium]|nr:cysteine desulfurase [Candidatus Lloydbacteria bacterium]